jgi:hypothetical protein
LPCEDINAVHFLKIDTNFGDDFHGHFFIDKKKKKLITCPPAATGAWVDWSALPPEHEAQIKPADACRGHNDEVHSGINVVLVFF